MTRSDSLKEKKRRRKRKHKIVPEITKETEAQKVYAWRVKQYRKMGFSKEDAWKLADSKIDWQLVEAAIKSDCSHETALKIFL